MPKKNKYVIMNKKDKTFYRHRRNWTDDYWGGINIAMTFGREELRDQMNMLVRNTEHYEVIFRIDDEGKLILVY
jgi:hypothetical protein